MGFFPRLKTQPVDAVNPKVEWEEAPCLLCRNRSCLPLVEAPDNTPGGRGLWFAVVQCQKCGLCFTNPRPSPASIVQFYPNDYRPHRLPDGRRRKRRGWKLRISWQPPRACRKRLPAQGQGRLLDFGCGGGSFLERMNRQGWNVTGLDMSPVAVQGIRTRLGLKALLGSLPHPDLQPESFDAITMWQSLEHVHEPLKILRQANLLLAPGGKLLVAVPNIDSLAFRWFGRSWFGLDLPRHLTHFTPSTLRMMLQQAGFRVGRVQMAAHSSWLRSSARLACQNPGSPYWQRWLKTKTASRLVAGFSNLTHQADCIMLTAEKRGR